MSITFNSLIQEAQQHAVTPFTGSPSNSMYSLKAVTPTTTDRQKAILLSGKRVEDMTQEELREVYYYITGAPMSPLYTATAINYIAKHGYRPEEAPPEESDSLFIGSEVHLAVETEGESINRLRTFSVLGKAPEPPEVSFGDNKDLWRMAEMCAGGKKAAEAYWAVKDNQTTKAISQQDLIDVGSGIDLLDDKKKAMQKLNDTAVKEFVKFEKDLPAIKLYLEKKVKYEEAKAAFRSKGHFIIDDLPYRKTNPDSILETIKKTYDAFRQDPILPLVYRQLYAESKPGMESHTEYVVLWKYFTGSRYVACKSMLDKIHIDWDKRTMAIIDVKTHSKKGTQFLDTNYVEYAYDRSMSFYRECGYELLKQRGVPEAELQFWKILCLLLPVSTVYYEAGCYYPYLILSEEDMNLGKNGGFVKPFGSKFNENGHVQYALSIAQFEKLKELGLVCEQSYDFRRKGWKQIIDDQERKASATPFQV